MGKENDNVNHPAQYEERRRGFEKSKMVFG